MPSVSATKPATAEQSPVRRYLADTRRDSAASGVPSSEEAQLTKVRMARSFCCGRQVRIDVAGRSPTEVELEPANVERSHAGDPILSTGAVLLIRDVDVQHVRRERERHLHPTTVVIADLGQVSLDIEKPRAVRARALSPSLTRQRPVRDDRAADGTAARHGRRCVHQAAHRSNEDRPDDAETHRRRLPG